MYPPRPLAHAATPRPPPWRCAGLRIGLYSPFKALVGADTSDSALLQKIGAGMASGALAAGLCNPTDLVKTRMQTAGASAGPLAVASEVVRKEGVAALWKGSTPRCVCEG